MSPHNFNRYRNSKPFPRFVIVIKQEVHLLDAQLSLNAKKLLSVLC